MNYDKTAGATHVLIPVKQLEKYISESIYPVSMRNHFFRFEQVIIKDGKIIQRLPKTKIKRK